MAIYISKKRIRATGGDASGLLIAMADDAKLLEWEQKQTGSEEFQRMVKEAVAARRLHSENDQAHAPRI